MQPASAVAQELVASRYVLMDRIGQGGVAVVYRARDERLGRIVALKILREHLATDPEFQARFQREARIAAGLAHPNIVGVHDYGAYGDAAFIAMDFVDGVTLKERIRAVGRLPVEEAIGIARAVLSALAYAHTRGVVHRDVKPQNVMIDREGHVELTDFGIAQAAEAAGLTQTGNTVGSAAYMAPEQARGEPVGPATDVYGAGLLLYEMLVGRPPFDGQALVQVLYRQLNEAPAPPSSLGLV
ncbi:MAG TPA: protein kinase, partial [Chloroflexota bacterium]